MPSVTLVFEEAKDEHDADITILWAEGEHGDEYKFDDAGDEINILAHTFYPNYHRGTLNGDIHLGNNSAVICLHLKINMLIKILFADSNF